MSYEEDLMNNEWTREIERLRKERGELLAACKCALADLEGIMPEFDPDGGNYPAWQTIGQLKGIIKQSEQRESA